MNILFVVDKYYSKNKIFNITHCDNRDNIFYPYFKLKNSFLEKGFDFPADDIKPIEDSEIVIYNDMPKVLSKQQVIYKSYLLLFESEVIKPKNWDMKKNKYFNKIFIWNDKIIYNKKYFKINFSHLFPKSINRDLSKKENLCTFIAENKSAKYPLELYSKIVGAITWFEADHLEKFNFYEVDWDRYAFKKIY